MQITIKSGFDGSKYAFLIHFDLGQVLDYKLGQKPPNASRISVCCGANSKTYGQILITFSEMRERFFTFWCWSKPGVSELPWQMFARSECSFISSSVFGVPLLTCQTKSWDLTLHCWQKRDRRADCLLYSFLIILQLYLVAFFPSCHNT